ncbi:hypothetical protein T439DRAFT_119644 [Meredithblackwellia eburnea MCA 4105]
MTERALAESLPPPSYDYFALIPQALTPAPHAQHPVPVQEPAPAQASAHPRPQPQPMQVDDEDINLQQQTTTSVTLVEANVSARTAPLDDDASPRSVDAFGRPRVTPQEREEARLQRMRARRLAAYQQMLDEAAARQANPSPSNSVPPSPNPSHHGHNHHRHHSRSHSIHSSRSSNSIAALAAANANANASNANPLSRIPSHHEEAVDPYTLAEQLEQRMRRASSAAGGGGAGVGGGGGGTSSAATSVNWNATRKTPEQRERERLERIRLRREGGGRVLTVNSLFPTSQAGPSTSSGMSSSGSSRSNRRSGVYSRSAAAASRESLENEMRRATQGGGVRAI